MNKNSRIYQIDLFRFIAALSVVFYHYLFRGYASDDMSILDFSEFGSIFKYGYLGVDLFFIISGFVIALSIKHRSITKFIISRISRLYPIYWICVVFTFLITVWLGAPRYSADFWQLAGNLSMFQNYLGIENIDGVYWTLFVEMKFYIFVIGTYLVINKIRPIELDYVIFFWLGLTILNIFLGDFFVFKALNYFLILYWSTYFIAGILFYQIYKKGISLKYLTLLLLSLAIAIYYATLKNGYLEIEFNTSFSPFISGGLIFIFYLFMFLVSTHRLKTINSPKLTALGMLTYPLYLLHQNIGFMLFNTFGTTFNKYALMILTTFLMLFIAFLLSKYYEPFVSKYLKRSLSRLEK